MNGFEHPAEPTLLFDEADVRHALECLRRAEPLGESSLRSLVLVWERLEEHAATTSAALDVALGDLLARIIEENLSRLRCLEGLPHQPANDRQAEMDALLADFACGNVELEAWSGLYYRYVRADLDLHMLDIAHRLGQDTRQVRRRLAHGLRRLTLELSEMESEARAENHRLWMRLKLPPLGYGRLFGMEEASGWLADALLGHAVPPVVALVGAGGLGKTTLAHTVVRHIIDQDRFADLAWLTLGVPTPYPALLGDLARALGAPHLGMLTALDLEAALRVRLARTPTLLVVDEADLLDDYAQAALRLGVLVEDGRALLISRQQPPADTPVQVVRVEPLPLPDMADLIRHQAHLRRVPQAQRLDEEAIEAIYHVIGGNPLAARLVVGQLAALPLERVLSDLGGLRMVDGQALFDTLFGPTWDRLSEDARQVALAMLLLPPGAVLWRDVCAVADLPDDALDRALDELVAASLLDACGDEPRYAMHALTRRFVESQVAAEPAASAFDDLLGSAVRERQARYRVTPADVVGAMHLLRVEAVRGGQPDALVDLIAAVAPSARRSGRWAEWIDLLAQAETRLQVDPDSAGLAAVRLEAGIAWRWLGQSERATHALEAAIAGFGERGQFVRQAEALIELGALHHQAGQTDLAYSAYRRAADTAERHQAWAVLQRALNGLARLALHNDQIGQAIALLSQALDATPEPDPQTLSNLGVALLRAGQVERAIDAHQRALALVQRAGDLPRQARAHIRLATAYVEHGDLQAALRHLDDGLRLLRNLGDALGQARALTNLGIVYHRHGDDQAALQAWGEALALQQHLDDQVGMAYTWYNLADLHWSVGRQDAAHQAIREAHRLADRLNLPALLARIHVHPASPGALPYESGQAGQ
jgi:tetratricopeptide (TPR) repeat protein